MSIEKKALIIDDETDFCYLLKEYLTGKQYTVFLSHTLQNGRLLMNETRPDVLFLDNNLPDGLGWAAASEIAMSFPLTTFILVSAYNPEIPVMPEHTRFKVIEKPISMRYLDAELGVL